MWLPLYKNEPYFVLWDYFGFNLRKVHVIGIHCVMWATSKAILYWIQTNITFLLLYAILTYKKNDFFLTDNWNTECKQCLCYFKILYFHIDVPHLPVACRSISLDHLVTYKWHHSWIEHFFLKPKWC